MCGGRGEGGAYYYLSNRRRNAIILSSHSRRTRLRRHKTNIITRPHLAERQEEAIHDREGRHILRGRKGRVASGHDVAEYGLEHQADNESPFGAEVV